MAQDTLRGHLACLEERGEKLPDPGNIRGIALEPGQVLVAVEAWMLPLRTKIIRKNLTIPAYPAEARKRPRNRASISLRPYPMPFRRDWACSGRIKIRILRRTEG
jgi:hypothetical protein